MKKLTTKMKNVIAFVLTVFLLGVFTSLVSLRAEAAPYGSYTANHVKCALFAHKLGKTAEVKIFTYMAATSGKPLEIIQKELDDTVAELEKMSKLEEVPVEELVEEMYANVCTYIKA